jgi:hypothetical protein
MNSYNGYPGSVRDRSARWVRSEIQAGRIPPPAECCICSQREGCLQYHAEDYSEPFGAHLTQFPICLRCHCVLHTRFRYPVRWTRYLEQLERGAVYPPLQNSRDLAPLWEPDWMERPAGWIEPRGRLAWPRSLAMVDRPDRLPLFD